MKRVLPVVAAMVAVLTTITAGGAEPRRLALLIGIDDYKSDTIPDLHGAENDVRALKAALEGLQFKPDDVKVLVNGQATRAAVLAAFQSHLIDQADANTVAYFHFSGYGSRMPARGTEEYDGYDETIVPYDSRQGDVFDITDDEQKRLFNHLIAKTPHVVATFDCGLVTLRQVPNQRSRALQIDERTPVGAHTSETAPSKHLRIFASREGDYVYEGAVDDATYGHFSYAWAAALKNAANAKMTYYDLFDETFLAVRKRQPAQRPVMEGDTGDEIAFGTEKTPTQPYVLATMEGLGVWVSGGRLQGLSPGDILRIYPPRSTGPDAAQSSAAVRIVNPGLDQARGELLRATEIPPASRIWIPAQSQTDQRLKIFVERGTIPSPALDRAVRDLRAAPLVFEIVDDRQGADFRIRRQLPWNPKPVGELELYDAADRKIWSVAERDPDIARKLLEHLLLGSMQLPADGKQAFAVEAPAMLPRQIHGLFVGIDEYKHKADVRPLQGCVNDAKAVSEAFRLVTTTHIELFNADATKGAILDAVQHLVANAGEDDLIILMFSSHGQLAYDDFYVVPHDYERTKTISTGLQFSVITDVLSSKRRLRTLILIDSCHSGQTGFNVARYRGSDFHASVMVSSAPDEVSVEIPKNGVTRGLFAWWLIEGFKGPADENQDQRITLRELFDYAYAKTKSESNHNQHPVLFGTLRQSTVIRTLGDGAAFSDVR